jgi:hypothetical protein
MDSAEEKRIQRHVCCPTYGGGDVERATNGNPSKRESESNNKSVAIPPKRKVSPLIHPGTPSRRESEAIGIPKPTSGNPSKGKVSPTILLNQPTKIPSKGKVSLPVRLTWGGSSPPAGQVATRLLPPVGTALVWRGLVPKTCRRMKSPMGKRPGKISRSNARTHSSSPHLASQRASTLWSKNSFPHLSAYVKCPSRNAHIKCLADPLGS